MYQYTNTMIIIVENVKSYRLLSVTFFNSANHAISGEIFGEISRFPQSEIFYPTHKYEVVDQLTSMEGFREQGSFKNGEEYPRTIINNEAMVGKNCLCWMEKIDGFTTRQNIYNKYVQMLECKSVRNSVGCHWKNWV
jgi:hypothetical protein